MNSGELVPDEIVIKLIIGKITIFKEKNIIFDRFSPVILIKLKFWTNLLKKFQYL